MSHSHNEDTGTAKITTKGYITGFILALVLTLASFGLTMSDTISHKTAIGGIIIAAFIQMIVHLRYFLHLDGSSAQRWNLLALMFTALLLFIFIGGTLWVMYALNSRMM